MLDATFTARRASMDDIELVSNVVDLAFRSDPLWSLAMRTPNGATDHHIQFWTLFVAGALRYPWVWIAGEGQATAVWIPPGGTELSEHQEDELAVVAGTALGERADDYFALLEEFERAHPRHEAHYYLSLLGTHPEHRGHGIGMQLLRHNLDLIDTEHAASYLESSNPANDRRYESVGFRPVGSIAYPGDGPTVTTMWRDAR